jgi:hypothetical protein
VRPTSLLIAFPYVFSAQAVSRALKAEKVKGFSEVLVAHELEAGLDHL